MGLINLKTDLKSLRYGNDRIGGADSGQPYITKDIPVGIGPYIGTTDFLLRGGVNAVTDSLEDIKRLGKMFVDTKSPNGLLFIAKQQLLSRTAVRTQTSGVLNEGVYSPLNTLAEAGLVAFGGHLNKQGINPFADTGAYSNNINLYGVRVKPNPNAPEESTLNNRLVKIYNEKQAIKNLNPNVLTYTGGPGSNLGVGNTNIRFSDQRTGVNNATSITTQRKPNPDSLKYLKTIFYNDTNKGVSGKYARLTNFDLISAYNPDGTLGSYYNFNVYESPIEGNTWPKNSPLIYNNGTFTYTQQDIIETNINLPNGVNPSPKSQDFRQVLRDKLGALKQNGRTSTESGATPFAPSYDIAKNQTIEGRVNLGDPGARANKSYASYTKGITYQQIDIPGIGAAPSGLDKINSIPIYRSEDAVHDKNVNDLVKFRIALIDNNKPNFKTFIHFRALLGSFSDNYSSTWNGFQYLGRGEQFYTYNGFTRQISLDWTVAAQSKQELIPMYKKLNFLASALTPNYGDTGYMRGVLAQLTVGGYLYEQPGFISSLTYTIDNETPWEIGITDGDGTGEAGSDPTVKELPHIIKVSGFNFTPIHNFIPQRQKNLYGANGTSFVSTYGDQRYIALAAGTGPQDNNYDYKG